VVISQAIHCITSIYKSKPAVVYSVWHTSIPTLSRALPYSNRHSSYMIITMPQLSIRLWALITTGFLSSAAQGYIWPDVELDELESIRFEQSGPHNSGLIGLVKHCDGGHLNQGRNFGAEWLRTAYHDMATADVKAGTGGIDGSIAWETLRSENPGTGFNETLDNLASSVSNRASAADLIALLAQIAVAVCSNGTLVLPYRIGRVDAYGPGPEGVPEPQQNITEHTAAFARQGFNSSEMIALVACGHSIGGVHSSDFNTIVPRFNNNVSIASGILCPKSGD